MSKLTLNPEFGLFERDGKPFCSSRQVAEIFERRHDNVLQSIRAEIETISNLAPKIQGNKFVMNFANDNYIETKYKARGKYYPEFLLSKDGFTNIAFTFEGELAALHRINYISRFNAMEDFIKSLFEAKLEYPALTEAVMKAHDEPKHYHFSNEINMINRIVLGVTASQFKESRGLDKSVNSIRPYLNAVEIKSIGELQRVDVGLLVARHEYEERKQILGQYHRGRLLGLSA